VCYTERQFGKSTTNNSMNFQRAQSILEQFSGCRLVVLGDLMLDEFIWGEVRRISPEAPVPVVEVKRETWHLGGAGNVVSNLIDLGAQAMPIGIIGDDEAGRLLQKRFSEQKTNTDGLIVDQSRPTTRKSRIVAHSQQMVRADRENRTPIDSSIEEKVIAAFNSALASADAIIISDYDKGLLTPRLLETVIAETKAQEKFICLDPKIRNFSSYRKVDVITPNQLEAERASGIEITGDDSLLAAAHLIRDRLDCGNVLITRGEYGMSLLDAEDRLTQIPTVAREVFDVTGAGDTVIATLALAMAAGAGIVEAAIIANHAAGLVVGKVGTATISRADLLVSLSDLEQS